MYRKSNIKNNVGWRQKYRRVADDVNEILTEISADENILDKNCFPKMISTCNFDHNFTTDVASKTHKTLNDFNNCCSTPEQKLSENFSDFLSSEDDVTEFDEFNNIVDVQHFNRYGELETTLNLQKCSFDSQSSNTNDINTKLRIWALSHPSVPHSAVTSLLSILQKYHPTLPLDCRTLLATPTRIVIKQLVSGEYCHFSIKESLEQFVISHVKFNDNVIKLSINIDGLPLFHSSSDQFWPILGYIINCVNSNPFVIGIFYGKSKPSPLNLFFEDFISDMKCLLEKGIVVMNKRYHVILHSIVCDAPARAFIKCTKGHNGYASCDRCTQYGEYKGRIIFPNVDSPLRTNNSFLNQTDKDHHLNISPLTALNIDFISDFPLDYMHAVCLGVMRKLLNIWVSGNLRVRLSSHITQTLSKTLVLYSSFTPAEFNRKPRTLSELPRWKATEYRTFLLYTAPVLLKDSIIDIGIYEHFLLLHVGITILLSDSHLAKFGSETADKCLKHFVTHSRKLYGSEFLIYNTHILSHLSSDANKYGSLDSVSSFVFENYLGHLKLLLKSGKNPLQQVARRIIENNNMVFNRERNDKNLNEIDYTVQMEHCSGPLTADCSIGKQFKKIIFLQKKLTFTKNSHSSRDSYFITKDFIVVEIQNIVKTDEGIFLIGRQFLDYSDLYDYPLHSSELNIHIVSKLDTSLSKWSLNSVKSKCILLPYKKEKFVALPLIHAI